MKNFLRYDDILKISSLLSENGYDDFSLTIIDEIEDEKLLNRINDDFYYRLSGKEGKLDKTDEVNIEVGNFKFIYKLKDDDSKEDAS